jgi:hypothetical protein
MDQREQYSFFLEINDLLHHAIKKETKNIDCLQRARLPDPNHSG